MLWQMQSTLFSVRCFSLDVAGLSPCTVNVIGRHNFVIDLVRHGDLVASALVFHK